MEQDLLKELSNKVNLSIERLKSDLKSFKTGRANTAMLDNVKVEVYGTLLPLIQVASINIIDARVIQLSPFDPSTISNIANSIRNDSSLGLNPSDDGHFIRLIVPQLTEERRKELVKSIKVKIEECFIRIRADRHDAIKELDAALKDKSLSQDSYNRTEKQIETLIQNQKTIIETIANEKESEILKI